MRSPASSLIMRRTRWSSDWEPFQGGRTGLGGADRRVFSGIDRRGLRETPPVAGSFSAETSRDGAAPCSARDRGPESAAFQARRRASSKPLDRPRPCRNKGLGADRVRPNLNLVGAARTETRSAAVGEGLPKDRTRTSPGPGPEGADGASTGAQGPEERAVLGVSRRAESLRPPRPRRESPRDRRSGSRALPGAPSPS